MYSRIRTEKGRSARPYPLANSINECMFTGPPLQPLLWDIMVRARMSTNLLLGDIEKACQRRRQRYFQISLQYQRRRAVSEVHASAVWSGSQSFCVRSQHHIQQQGREFEDTVRALMENTYVDNLKQMGGDQ